MLVQLIVHEGRLHQGLTVVEHAVHLDGGDVLAQRRELALLDGAHLTLGVEHIDVDAVDAQEAVGNSRACVAAGSHQHVHLLPGTLLADEVLQQTGHEAGANVLERQRGAVEQLKGVDAVCYLRYGAVERQRVENDVLQGILVNILAKEGAGHVVGNVLELHVLNVVEEDLRQLLDFLRHIESAVFSQSFHHGLFERGYWGFSIRAVVFHRLFYFH